MWCYVRIDDHSGLNPNFKQSLMKKASIIIKLLLSNLTEPVAVIGISIVFALPEYFSWSSMKPTRGSVDLTFAGRELRKTVAPHVAAAHPIEGTRPIITPRSQKQYKKLSKLYNTTKYTI